MLNATATLRRVWAHQAFHPGQAQAIEAWLRGRDVQVLLPTGGGKSLCYQVPAVLAAQQRRGPTLVVSPLVALMEDQVRALLERGVHAVALHRGVERATLRTLEAHLAHATLIYASPERLASARFRGKLKAAGVCQVAIDEAHCISTWGHDFRKDYRNLGVLKEELGCPIMALTATATPQVLREIAESLRLEQPERVLGSFVRENLSLSVEHMTGDRARLDRLIALLQASKLGGRGQQGRVIVYAATRKRVVAVGKALKAAGLKAGWYHAGRTDNARAKAQADFAQSKTPILVATSAFGMGIDLPDIRLVAHIQAPGSLPAYYQQAGRAGRDGLPARGVLLYGPGDAVTQARLRRGHTHPGAELGWKALQGYVYGERCRQAMIVQHFTGAPSAPCGRCDVCTDAAAVQAQLQAARHKLDRAKTQRLAKAARDHAVTLQPEQLALVIRFVDSLRKPIGKSLIAAGLRGSRAKRVKKAKLQENPHFGSLKGVPEVAIQEAITTMLADGRLAKRGKKYPTVWMPSKRVRAPRPSGEKAPPPSSLRAALRAFRRREARRRRWKPYQIFPNETLDAVVSKQPTTPKQLMDLPGMGPTRMRRYSQALLELVRQHSGGATPSTAPLTALP